MTELQWEDDDDDDDDVALYSAQYPCMSSTSDAHDAVMLPEKDTTKRKQGKLGGGKVT